MTTEAVPAAAMVSVRLAGPVARITVGNGLRRNALTAAAWAELERLVDELGARERVRAIMVRGHGDTFCAGSDISEWLDADPDFVEESFARMEAAFRAIERCPVPVVAEIEGAAAGAGCQLALACDTRYMAESARIGMPIARLGILATPAFAARLTALAGPAVARALLYTGDLLNGRDAHAARLVNRAVPDGELHAEVEAVLDRICAQPPAAVRAAKQAVGAAYRPMREATEHNDLPSVSFDDFAAAVKAFLR
ncbi:MAG TPA: enoyl-CoA hydratase/isomerase family protein [Pseudonocardiaceae bacterium]|nr:enoyl-CoA hydratase/isomerase family protein [Pseudonocardiaceae bacterium]